MKQNPKDPKRYKGFVAEHLVGHILRAKGRRVEKLRHTAKGDLLVDGHLNIEVKTAAPQHRLDKTHNTLYWKFSINRHGKMNELCDYYVFRFEGIPGSPKPEHAVFKSPLGKLTIAFTLKKMLSDLGPHIRLFDDLRNGLLSGARR